MVLWACDAMNNCSANGYFPFSKTSMNIIQAKIPKSHLQKGTLGYHDGKPLVYLLALNGKVTYVGSTEDNFSNRFANHCKSAKFGDKSQFNEVYFIETKIYQLGELEKLMIGFFNPKDNKVNKGKDKLFDLVYKFFAEQVGKKKKFEIQKTLLNLIKKHFIGERSSLDPHFQTPSWKWVMPYYCVMPCFFTNGR